MEVNNVKPVSKNIPTPSLNTPPSQPKSPFIFILVGLFLLLSVGVSAFYLGSRINKTSQNTNQNSSSSATPSPLNSRNPSKEPIKENSALFSGKLAKLNTDLKVLKLNSYDKSNNYSLDVVYYSAGTFIKGKFAGYTRIIALKNTNSPAGISIFTLATKDNKMFVLDPNYSIINTEDTFEDINKDMIASVEPIDSEHSEEFDIDSHFSIYKNSIYTVSIPTDRKNDHNFPIYEMGILTDLSPFISLPTSQPIQLYAAKTPFIDESTYPGNDKEFIPIKNKYLAASTEVVVLDSTGLPYKYSLTNSHLISKYKSDKAAYEEALAKKDYQNAKYVSLPHLELNQSEISSDKPKFLTYDKAFPGACANDPTTFIVNINDSELQPFGSTSDYQLFMLKDPNHDLNKFEYQQKVVSPAWGGTPSMTYQEYISKNPLLFFKDTWGRWIAVGEYELKLAGGCGKPVLYLYPPKPTNVHISFNSSMQLTTDIPTYHNEWNVLAQPNGQLTDLQPQFTNCSLIDSTKRGSEYAYQACVQNQYPYIYWAGNSTFAKYPEIKNGWYVSKNDIQTFMNQKLDEVGLNAKEKSDMLAYWIPEMVEKNAPYYRISFLQTQDMNKIIPLNINPEPTSLFRIFLDYLPLNSKPLTPIQPEDLQKVNRSGFTVVEWGGLKQ